MRSRCLSYGRRGGRPPHRQFNRGRAGHRGVGEAGDDQESVAQTDALTPDVVPMDLAFLRVIWGAVFLTCPARTGNSEPERR